MSLNVRNIFTMSQIVRLNVDFGEYSAQLNWFHDNFFFCDHKIQTRAEINRNDFAGIRMSHQTPVRHSNALQRFDIVVFTFHSDISFLWPRKYVSLARSLCISLILCAHVQLLFSV